jgi:hypothetical protein
MQSCMGVLSLALAHCRQQAGFTFGPLNPAPARRENGVRIFSASGPRWESEGPIVPLKPGNAGGGKGPWFWVLRKELRERGLAERPRNPGRSWTLQRELDGWAKRNGTPERGEQGPQPRMPYRETSPGAGCGKSACPNR